MTGYAALDEKQSGSINIFHNFVFASVGRPTDEGAGVLRDCGKVLDPWKNGLPDVFSVGADPYYDWNLIFTDGVTWYWNGQKWVRLPTFPYPPISHDTY